MAKLVLISGKAESGKTLAANILKKLLEAKGKKVTLLPFASYLKFICREHFGWDGKKNEEGRRILQHVGTDIVRKRNPDFWVEIVAKFVETFGEDFDYIICDDTRFVNEIEYFRSLDPFLYVAVRIERLNYENSLTPEQKKHPSETNLDDYDMFDIRIQAETGAENVEREIKKTMFDRNLQKAFFDE